MKFFWICTLVVILNGCINTDGASIQVNTQTSVTVTDPGNETTTEATPGADFNSTTIQTSDNETTTTSAPDTDANTTTSATTTTTEASNATTPSFVPWNVTDTPDCPDLHQATFCLNTALESMTTHLFASALARNITEEAKEAVCREFESYRECAKPFLAGCEPSTILAFEMFDSGFDYLCNQDGFASIASLLPCLSNQAIAEDLRICAANIPTNVSNDELCSLPDGYAQCILNAISSECTYDDWEETTSILDAVFTPYKDSVCDPATTPEPTTTTTTPETTTTTITTTTTTTDDPCGPDPTTTEATNTTVDYNTTAAQDLNSTTPEPDMNTTAEANVTATTTAVPDDNNTTTTSEHTTTTTSSTAATSTTTTTTTTEPPPFQCYDCHSGAPGGWMTRECPINGGLYGWARYNTRPCYGPCVAKVNRWPKGDVQRSCSTNFWFGGMPLPNKGCLTFDQNIYCFCTGDFCNDVDMTEHSQNMVDMYP